MKTVLFISLGLIIILLISIFTARMYTSVLRLSHPVNRTILGTTLLIPLMFVASLISSRSLSWGIGPVFYTIINALAGVFFYLFLGAILLLVISLIYLTAGRTLPVFIPWFILFISLGLGITGLIQARFIKIKTYDITLSGTPQAWRGRKIILISDTHFGLVNQTKFSDKIVNKILALQPDLVLHAGDFYDGPKIDLSAISNYWQKLTMSIPVYYAPGNHEMYGDYPAFIQSIKNAGITVLENDKITSEGLQIAGLTYLPGKNPPEASAELQAMNLDPNLPTILINHSPTSLEAANLSAIDLMVSGHTHNGQFWPNNFITRQVYGPQAYGYDRYKDLQIITSSGIGTFGPPLRLFNTPEIVIVNLK